jgi:hypothetical protein
MHRRFVTFFAAASAAVASLALAPLPGSAAVNYTYFGQAGGTQITALGTTIRSDLTAESRLIGTKYPNSVSNTTASVNVASLAKVGAIETSVNATKVGTLETTKSSADIAKVSLLNGVVRADALTTHATVTRNGDTLDGFGDTDLVNLKVGRIKVPVDAAPNTTITVGNLATVVVNEQKTTRVGEKIVQEGSALKVTLLRGRGKVPTGASITVNPVRAAYGPSIPPKSPAVGGNAFGSLVKVSAGSIKAVSGPTAYTQLPPFGTNGVPIVNSTARVRVTGVITAGAVESISSATSVPLTADVMDSNQIARVNLLGGAIKASAIHVIATANLDAAGNVTVNGTMDTVKLEIGGHEIPVDVAPNTAITIPGIASVVVNEQVKTARKITVTGLHITLLKPAGELGIGADIRVSEATSLIY